ncbi:terpenoid synthase [Penicillium frequentans]|nr:terpenoid synthase [Penicillium glabrum]
MSTEFSSPIFIGKTGQPAHETLIQASSLSPQSSQLRKTTVPPYVDNENFYFKHNRDELCLKFTSDWKESQKSMDTHSDVWAMYFPPSMNLEYDSELESRLAQDLSDWPCLKSIDAPLARLGLQVARLCSIKSPLSYERRILLHRHVTWIFYMDQVSEKLALYDLHSTAGKTYLDNLKSILRDGPVTDMTQFKGSCPDKLIENAINAQRILAEDLIPLKKKLLPHIIFGTMVPSILYMTTEQAELFTPEDPCLIQLSVMAALWNDMIGIFKDLDSIDKQDDGSVYLNFVRASMRDQGLTVRDALRGCAQRLNTLIHDFEFYLTSYRPARRQFYHANLEFTFMYFDFHLMGLKESASERYGWKIIR